MESVQELVVLESPDRSQACFHGSSRCKTLAERE